MAYIRVDVDLEEFDNDEILEEIEDRIRYDKDFQKEVKKILEKNMKQIVDVRDSEIIENLKSIGHWQQSYARAWFETLPFSEGLIKWIKQTYATQN